MTKFKLHRGTPLQSYFQPKNLNVAFVFQVNCPGCFIYGIPMMNKLFNDFAHSVGFIGISTAFEDFQYNTEENTQLLLKDGTMVGETQKHFQQASISLYPDIPQFPIAFDELTNGKTINMDELVAGFFESTAESVHWDDAYKKEIKGRLGSYYKNLKSIAKTFTLNQMKGTPTFVIFDKEYTILDHSFGHVSEDHIRNILSTIQ